MTTSCVREKTAWLRGITLILVLYNGSFIEAKVCPTQWFGPSCTYKCNCETDCSDTGECTTCQRSYFGLNCQYVDLVQISDRRRQIVLTDGNDNTCSTASNTHISIVFPQTLFTNFLLVASAPAAFDDISYSLSLDDNEITNPCQGEVFSTFLKPNVKAFYCTTSTIVSEIILTGKGVPLLCTVSVNGGRNVALKQTQIEADTASSINGVEGVDGQVAAVPTKGSGCYTSSKKDAEAMYKVTLNQPMILFSFRILNVEFSYRNMHNFSLLTYDENNAIIMNYLDKSIRGQPDVRVPHSSTKKIKSFQLKRLVKSGTSFEFCEIEAYGDCPVTKYGLSCSQTCNTNCVDQLCMANGMCWKCKDGFHGPDCSKVCSESCSQQKCQQLDGICEGGCKPKKSGPFCDKECDSKDGVCLGECDAGLSGPACTLACPEGKVCKASCSTGPNSTCKSCSISTDQCLECKAGRYGEDCEIDCPGSCQPRACLMNSGECTFGCAMGYYGNDCVYICSENCAGNRTCARESGACLFGCKPGFFGEKCQPREEVKTCSSNGYYGADCTKICSQNCGGKKACEQQTGECLDGCTTGYHGGNCSKECKNCVDNLCEQYTGNCILGCAEGFTGPDCVVGPSGLAKPEESWSLTLYIITFFLIVTICVMVYVFLRSKKVTLGEIVE